MRFMKGEHRSPDYLKVNPKGKVPALVMDGQALTENVAILSYLNLKHPEAKLLPPARDDFERAKQVADLSFCASTLHPIVTRIRIPGFFAEGEGCIKSVYQAGVAAMRPNFALIDERLSGQPWWYGDQWSVMDAYINWVWFRVTGAGFPGQDYPAFEGHAKRIEALPAVKRMLARDAEAEAELKAEGLHFVLPKPPV